MTQQDSLWKLILASGFLLFFAAIGVAQVVNPDRFIRRSAVRKGGEMLTEWNRLQFQAAGAIFVAAAGYILYEVWRDYFSH